MNPLSSAFLAASSAKKFRLTSHLALAVLLTLFVLWPAYGQEPHSLAEPPNLGILKETVKFYLESGAYTRDIGARVEEAKGYLAATHRQGARNAIVLDIDETALSNMPYEKEFDFGYSSKTWDEWVRKAEATAITPTLELFKWAHAQGIEVFFITGRRQLADKLAEDPTVMNLKKVGYDGWRAIYFKPSGVRLSAAQIKSDRRAEIAAQGYTIIACIGDQYSDLSGDNVGRAFKLPNPFYYVP